MALLKVLKVRGKIHNSVLLFYFYNLGVFFVRGGLRHRLREAQTSVVGCVGKSVNVLIRT